MMIGDERHSSAKSPWLRRLGLCGIVLLLVGMAGLVVFWFTSENALDHAIAEADRLDPGWRWEELLAKRPTIPDEENAALQVLKVRRLLPPGWSSRVDGLVTPPITESDDPEAREDMSLGLVPSNVRLRPKQTAALRGDMAMLEEALVEARKIAEMPRGSLPLGDPVDFVSRPFQGLSDFPPVTSLLRYDALLRAESGDVRGAVRANRALLRTGQCLDDNPTLIAQLNNGAIMCAALENLERLLAQDEAPDQDLTALQRLLELSIAQNSLLVALRGERALGFQLTKETMKRTTRASFSINAVPGWQTANQAAVLEMMTRAVELAKLPPEEQVTRFAELENEVKHVRGNSLWRVNRHYHAVMFMPAVFKSSETAHRCRAMSGAALLAVGAERFRTQHGQWPERLEQLSEFVKEMPLDPYDRKPFKLKRLADGMVIYSVGHDGMDDGGTLDRRNPVRDGADVGFQLWDVDHRRMPSRPIHVIDGPKP